MQHFPNCKTFNINLNTFIPISTIQLENELLLNKNFKYLLNYHFYNYVMKMSKDKIINKETSKKSFIEHLIGVIKTEKGITREKIENIIKENNNPDIDDEIMSIIKEIKEKFSGQDINYGISEEDFNINNGGDNLLDEVDNEIEEENENHDVNNNIEEMNPSYILKLLYIFQKDKKLIPPMSEETYQLLNYFKLKKKSSKTVKPKVEVRVSERTILNKRLIDHLNTISSKIKKSKFISNEINKICDEITKTIDYLDIYDVIFISFLGPSNAGKTTIINDIIGEDILPADLNESTKRGIIIRYFDDNETEINIRKVNFIEEEFLGKKKYYFESQDIIAKGLKGVQETVKGLNYDFNKKEEDSFYYIRTKIKLFDDLGLDNYYKKMIYLIDFPGYGTNNVFEL